MKNFIIVFQNQKGMPIQILCDPLLKQIKLCQERHDKPENEGVDGYQLNSIDFELFKVLVQHEKL